MMLNDLQNFPAKSSWAKSVTSLLDNLGLWHVWIEQGVGNINMFVRIFKERLTDNFVQGWDYEVHNSSRANTYKLISNFSFKDYLDFVTVRKFRYAFTRLRVASHRLEIETGRWHNPYRTPIEERKCLFCNCLEDEFHFILECHLYQDLRNEYIKKYIWNRPNIPKFNELLQSENKKTIKNLSVYIYKSFKKRNEFYTKRYFSPQNIDKD